MLFAGKLIILMVLSTFFFTISITWTNIFNYIYRSIAVLAPQSVIYKSWVNIPVPIYMDLYTFDWVNAKEFQKDPSTIPQFQEVGPFVFQVIYGKANVTWNNDESTVGFNQKKTWKFIPELSKDMSVNVTNLNTVALTIAYMSRQWESKLFRKIGNVLINKFESLFVTAPAANWLFDGIEHQILNMMNQLKNYTDILIPQDKFGWFYGRNESTDYEGRFEIKTGASDLYDMGNLVRWNNMNVTQYYTGECARVKGTIGEIMPPIREFQTRITTFSSDLCSYLSFNYAGPTVVNGVKGNLYESDESIFDDGNLYPDNKCFCTGECSPSGTRNASSCRFGAPAFVSFPHFYLADPVYLQSVNGLTPNKELHSFKIKLEPRTGLALELQAGLQINLLLQHYEWCDMFPKKKIYVPMIWFQQRARISTELSLALKLLLFASDYGAFVFFALTEIFVVSLLIILIRGMKFKKLNVTNISTHKS